MSTTLNKNKVLTLISDYLILTLGTVIYCLAWTSFIIPNGLTSGGLTGLCTIIQYGTDIPIGVTFPIINAMLLLLGFLIMGKAFGFRTIYVIVLSSILLKVFPDYCPFLEVPMKEPVLVALVGGAIEAFGIGLTILRGGSTGGTDILALIVNKYWPVSPGKVYLVADMFIIALLLLIPGKTIEDMIYGYVIMLTFSFGIDYVLLGQKSSVQILVFSSKYEDIADHVINHFHRGVTALQSVGWYTKSESKVLLIIAYKTQLNTITREIRRIDKNAFISVSDAKSVYGEGFEELKLGTSKKAGKGADKDSSNASELLESPAVSDNSAENLGHEAR